MLLYQPRHFLQVAPRIFQLVGISFEPHAVMYMLCLLPATYSTLCDIKVMKTVISVWMITICIRNASGTQACSPIQCTKLGQWTVKFEVFTTMKMRIVVFWIVTPCSLVGPQDITIHSE